VGGKFWGKIDEKVVKIARQNPPLSFKLQLDDLVRALYVNTYSECGGTEEEVRGQV